MYLQSATYPLEAFHGLNDFSMPIASRLYIENVEGTQQCVRFFDIDVTSWPMRFVQLSSQHFEYMPKAVGILGSDHTVQFCLKGGGLNLLKINTFVPRYNRCWPKYLLLGIRNGKTTNATHSGPTTFLSSKLCASLLLLINNIALQLSTTLMIQSCPSLLSPFKI